MSTSCKTVRTACLMAVLASTGLLALSGSAASEPMTEQQFRGSCYANGGTNAITWCDRFLSAAQANMGSLQSCLDACKGQLQGIHVISRGIDTANTMCQRYCRSNLSK